MAENGTESRGWQVGKTLKESFGLLFQNQHLCDFTFVIELDDGTNRKLGAHKLILSARSPVFEVMFSGNFSDEHKVIIVDSHVEPFSEMLKYIYSEELNLTGENVLQILNLARKYIIDGLVEQCTQYMKEKMTADNVCGILTHSIYFNEDQITIDCLGLAWTKMKEVCQSAGFLTMSQVALHRLLTADEGGHTDGFTEADLLTAVLKWAESQRNVDKTKDIRGHLGDCIYSIRFSNLTCEAFATMIGQTPILTHTEMSEWLCFLANKHDIHKNKLENWGFNTSPRGLVVMRANPSRVPNAGNTASIQEVFTITASKKVTLDQFRVYGGAHGQVSDVTITIKNNNTGTSEIHKAQFTADGTDKLYPVPLIKQTSLDPNINYSVTVVANNVDYICKIGTPYNFSLNWLNVTIQPGQWAGGLGSHGIVAGVTMHCPLQ